MSCENQNGFVCTATSDERLSASTSWVRCKSLARKGHSHTFIHVNSRQLRFWTINSIFWTSRLPGLRTKRRNVRNHSSCPSIPSRKTATKQQHRSCLSASLYSFLAHSVGCVKPSSPKGQRFPRSFKSSNLGNSTPRIFRPEIPLAS